MLIARSAVDLSVFFLKSRAPPGTTPFPYTTLFRSELPLRLGRKPLARPLRVGLRIGVRHLTDGLVVLRLGVGPVGRSEEHTSELQSQSNLVCRLLLEKKK